MYINKIMVVTICLFSWATFGYCQEGSIESAKERAIKINIPSLLFSNLSLSYQQAVSDKISLQLQASTFLDFTDGTAVTISPEIRYNLSKRLSSIEGFYTGGFLRYRNYYVSSADFLDTEDSNAFGLGALLGYQALFGKSNKIAFDIFMGPGYNVFRENDFLAKVFLRSGILVGYAF
jgi:hypothetical protein